ncbi:hypothetical protein [Azohydromonas sp.]|uniref:hypothetical protein n=1 Tax=Azohydromonas sp. TaxID=1872666 RepID=UPI002C491500|nr:hypothetical protein [Azohydromonas sp.]HMM84661.1 hypothetical protein [Azohydromonas sp.]
MRDLASEMTLDAWRGDVTIFRGFFDTAPLRELRDARWGELVDAVAPASGPAIVENKEAAPYFVPCSLKEAPLVGRTRERAEREGRPLEGRQRSAAHVSDATWLVFDLDGLSPNAFEAAGRALKQGGVAFVAWTSWSIGLKPGLRARLALPVDSALDSSRYARAWRGANALLFEGGADGTGSRLYQQQGAWCAAPSRSRLARRWVVEGGVASAHALAIAVGGVASSRQRRAVPARNVCIWPVASVCIAQVEHALRMFDPNDYEDWNRAISLLAAIARDAGDLHDELREMAVTFSDRADPERRAGNDKPQYDPRLRFDRWKSHIGLDAAAGALFKTARDRALAACLDAVRSGRWHGTKGAWTYLVAYHPKTWEGVREVMGVAA